MALFYTSVSRILQSEPALGSLTSVTSGMLFAYAQDAEAEVDACIAIRYTVPISGTPPILQRIATDISLYRILSQRIFTAEQLKDSAWPRVFKDAEKTLEAIAEGQKLIVASGGSIVSQHDDIGEVWSSTSEYNPTHHDGQWEEQVVDPDKIDDIRSDRNIGGVRKVVR